MFYSHAYETYTPNPVFEDGKTFRTPVEGTIPVDFVPFQYTLDPGDRERAGVELQNPISNNEENIERGKYEYEVFCSICHGETGDGKGYLFTSGLYVAIPRSLIDERARSLKDGEVYHTITLGFGSMGSHGSQILPDDRWKIINYINEVLQKEIVADTISGN
jgi:mono/diheme cytochrome c family protein